MHSFLSDLLPPGGPEPLAAFTSLTSLEIQGLSFSSVGVEYLNALTRLTHLNLDRCDLSVAQIGQLTRLTRVQELGLAGTRARHDGEPRRSAAQLFRMAFAGFPCLTNLDLSFCWEWASCGALSTLTGLTHLHCLSARPLERPEALRGLGQLQSLTLSMMDERVELSCLTGLTGLTRLVVGTMVKGAWTKTSMAPLLRLTALRALRVTAHDDDVLRPSILGTLAKLPALRALDLSLCKLPRYCSLAPLARMPLMWLCVPQVPGLQLPQHLLLPCLRGARANFFTLEAQRLADT